MPRILLVGTGITSAVAGTLIRQYLPQAELIRWEKARGVGGRMCTHWFTKDPDSTLDLGAQYISITPEYAKIHERWYDELKKLSLISPMIPKVGGMRRPIQEGTSHYIAPKGISSIVKYFHHYIDGDIKFEHHVSKIDRVDKRWNVITRNGVQDQFDLVILTMPVPQILSLSGTIKTLINENRLLGKHLREVEYSSRYALGLFFENGSTISLDDNNCSEYIASDPIMRFVSIDTLKRSDDYVSPSVVFHTSVPFGKAHLEKPQAEVEAILLAKVKELYPEWPKPVEVRCHKWRYSQVTSGYAGLPGAVEIDTGLMAGGDGFTQSNFDSCLESARTIAAMALEFSEKYS